MSHGFEDQLAALRADSLDRHLREIGSAQGPVVETGGRRLINFSSNDYLGLANDPRLREAACAAIREFGVGAGASRLISGTQSPHLRLEDALAKWKGTEAALIFGSGYATAVGTISAVATKQDVVILDKLCHASLIDGAKLSGATLRIFPHNNLERLAHHLAWAQQTKPNARVMIVTESVFSMDGDRAPIRKIVELKERFNACLLVDEAHAIGVLGPNGRGLAAEEGLASKIDFQMGTLSKALGGSGGYVCASRDSIDWLINRARSFIFTTAPPPSVAAAGLAALEFLNSSDGEERRQRLWRNIERLSGRLPTMAGIGKTMPARSAILPLIVGEEQRALDTSRELADRGFLVPAIRYPTVAKGAARLRATVTASHDDEQIDALLSALNTINRK